MNQAMCLKKGVEELAEELMESAFNYIKEAHSLQYALNPETTLVLRFVTGNADCYFANLLEGYHIPPGLVEKAFSGQYEEDLSIRNLQLLSRAHSKTHQLAMEQVLLDADKRAFSGDLATWIHQSFFRRVPKEFREARSGAEITPGRWIKQDASQAKTDVFSDTLPSFKNQGVHHLLAIIVHHAYLMAHWAEPVSESRIVRLHTQACLRMADMDAGGLWSFCRMLFHNRQAYHRFLKSISEKEDLMELKLPATDRLIYSFSAFFLNAFISEIRSMKNLLQQDVLLGRVRKYIALRSAGLDGFRPLRTEAYYLLESTFLRGKVPRGEAGRICGLGERTARSLVSAMLSEGLLLSENHRAPLRLGIPSHVSDWWLPGLFPAGADTPV
ncbi:hypothetical protein QLX67_02975 [Balneolaceae bacterium ANBcel3]|nr:hypothetical protein [Balneolaceae bacterium ANBcel3]